MKKGLIFIFAAGLAIMMCGPAWSLDEVYHVKETIGDPGDAIIFPGYLAETGGWETKFTVINTDADRSVICKVIIRSAKWTSELLDFLIYLSPHDMWTGFLRWENGQLILWSDDDSILRTKTEFASVAQPVSQPMLGTICADDTMKMGYVEVIETWWGDTSNYANRGITGWADWDTVAPTVDKEALLALYPPDTTSPQPAGWDGTINSSGVDHTINAITGYMEIQNGIMARTYPSEGDYTGAMRGVVLADLDMLKYQNVLVASGLDQLRENAAEVAARNTLGEVEAVLAKNEIAMPYLNKPELGTATAHFFNFPTKQSAPAPGENCVYGAANPKGPFWKQLIYPNTTKPAQCIQYTALVTDRMEFFKQGGDIWSGSPGSTPNSMCYELEHLTSDKPVFFSEGWVLYDFSIPQGWTDFVPGRVNTPNVDTPIFSFAGVPVIPWLMHVKEGSLSMAKGSWGEVGVVLASASATYQRIDNDVKAAGEWLLDTTQTPNVLVRNPAWIPDYGTWNYHYALGDHDANTGYPSTGSWTGAAPTIPLTLEP